MAKEDKTTGLVILGIVGVIAILGLVLLFGGGKASTGDAIAGAYTECYFEKTSGIGAPCAIRILKPKGYDCAKNPNYPLDDTDLPLCP